MYINKHETEVVASKIRDAAIKRQINTVIQTGPSAVEEYKNGVITREDLLDMKKILEVNGYGESNLFDLSYSFIKRILG